MIALSGDVIAQAVRHARARVDHILVCRAWRSALLSRAEIVLPSDDELCDDILMASRNSGAVDALVDAAARVICLPRSLFEAAGRRAPSQRCVALAQAALEQAGSIIKIPRTLRLTWPEIAAALSARGDAQFLWRVPVGAGIVTRFRDVNLMCAQTYQSYRDHMRLTRTGWRSTTKPRTAQTEMLIDAWYDQYLRIINSFARI